MPDNDKETSGSGIIPEQDSFTKLDINSLPPELKETYNSMLSDYRRKTEEIANQRKGFETKESEYTSKLTQAENTLKEWNNWYGQEIKPYWNEFESYRVTGDQVEDQNQSMKSDEDHGYSDDGVLKGLQDKISQFENIMTQKEVEFKNYINLNNQAWDLRLKHQNDTEFDINKVVEHALKSNNPDLYAAYNEVYRDVEKERFAEKRLEEEKKKWEEEQRNKNLNIQTGTGTPLGNVFGYKSPAKKSKQDTLAEVANNIAKKYPEFL